MRAQRGRKKASRREHGRAAAAAEPQLANRRALASARACTAGARSAARARGPRGAPHARAKRQGGGGRGVEHLLVQIGFGAARAGLGRRGRRRERAEEEMQAAPEDALAQVKAQAAAVCPAFAKAPVDGTLVHASPRHALKKLLRAAADEHAKAGDPVTARAALDAVLARIGDSAGEETEEKDAGHAVESVHGGAEVKLSTLLKEETRQVHREAENVAFIRAFIKCKLGKDDYCAFIVRMYHVYCALEEAFDHACTEDEPASSVHQEALRSIWFPKVLARKERLAEDLAFLLGDNWREDPNVQTLSRASRCYVGRLKQLAENNPLLLVGHAYTRYLGDLSGGQTLRRMARKSLQLEGDEGTAFYVFPEISSAKEFKNMYRAQLDAMNLTEIEAAAIAQEAVLAFRLNIGLFLELDRICGLVAREPASSTPSGAPVPAVKRCPFVDTTPAAAAGLHHGLPRTLPHRQDMSLSSLLKEETRQVHREAENVAFIRAFIKCKLSKSDYCAFIVRMYHVYTALEEAFAQACSKDDPVLSRHCEALRLIWFPEVLDRKERLEEDLAFFMGPNWREDVAVAVPSRASRCYMGRLKQLAESNPLLLVGHAYTRYLGDLSGGQTLRRMARKSLQLEGDEGTAFYVFPEISSAKDFKNMYRARLDAMDLSEDEAATIAEEAVLAFRLNIGLFLELDQVCGLVDAEKTPAPVHRASRCPFSPRTSEPSSSGGDAGSFSYWFGLPSSPFSPGSIVSPLTLSSAAVCVLGAVVASGATFGN